jgi:hypothetical protein
MHSADDGVLRVVWCGGVWAWKRDREGPRELTRVERLYVSGGEASTGSRGLKVSRSRGPDGLDGNSESCLGTPYCAEYKTK